jgi:hypothetical protein
MEILFIILPYKIKEVHSFQNRLLYSPPGISQLCTACRPAAQRRDSLKKDFLLFMSDRPQNKRTRCGNRNDNATPGYMRSCAHCLCK